MTIEAPTAPPPAGPLKAPPATARVRQRPGDGGPPPSLEVPEDAMQPPRIVLNAIEGFGKTSAIANAPRAAIIMDPMETGYLTLMGVGLAPRIPAAVVEQWPHLVQMVNDFAAAETVPFRVLGIDALTGFVSLLTAYICEREFGGNMTRKEGGFGNFGQGVDLCVEEWKRLEVALEKLRRRHRVAILMTSHYGSKTHRDPMQTSDYQRLVGDVSPRIWAQAMRWADAVLLGTFKSEVDGKKGVGGAERVIYTEHRDSHDAKNRYGLPYAIRVPNDPTKIWSTIIEHIQAGMAARKPAAGIPPAATEEGSNNGDPA